VSFKQVRRLRESSLEVPSTGGGPAVVAVVGRIGGCRSARVVCVIYLSIRMRLYVYAHACTCARES